MAAAIEISNLSKLFGTTAAVDGVSFSVASGEILVIVGASGCGKTTTLRCIAGLERPTSGTISIGGAVVSSETIFTPPERRGIGMMFQSYALWPHMTVFENIAYGLKIQKRPADDIKRLVERILNLVELPSLGDRYPSTLSGGQQQRVALARSAVAEPKVLLLDEPLSNLDAKLREQMRHDLRSLIKKLGITAVHITHDQTEAMAMADHIIYMRDGRIEQMGEPRKLYRLPVNRHVADFVGRATFLDGVVSRSEEHGIVEVRVADGVVLKSRASAACAASAEVTLAMRPESVVLSTQNPGAPNTVSGKVVDESFLGGYTEYVVDCGPFHLQSHSQHDFAVGSPVFASIDPERVICLPRQRTLPNA